MKRNSKCRQTKEQRLESRKTVYMMNFAKKRIITSGLYSIIIDGKSKKVNSLNKKLTYKIYLDIFKTNLKNDFESKEKHLKPFHRKSKKVREEILKTKREEYQNHLKSHKWKKLRLEIIEKFKSTCQKCFNPFPKRMLHLHHLHYNTLGNETEKDVLLVCKPCHEKIHGRKF